MLALVKVFGSAPAYDYPQTLYVVEIKNDDAELRGTFATSCHAEAFDFAKRVNTYKVLEEMLSDANEKVKRLEANLKERIRRDRKLRRGKAKGGVK